MVSLQFAPSSTPPTESLRTDPNTPPKTAYAETRRANIVASTPQKGMQVLDSNQKHTSLDQGPGLRSAAKNSRLVLGPNVWKLGFDSPW